MNNQQGISKDTTTLSEAAQIILHLMVKLTDEDVSHLACRFKLEQESNNQKRISAEKEALKSRASALGMVVTLDYAEDMEKRKTGIRKGTKAKAKYRDASTGQEWSGRGLKPQWIKDLESEGKDLDDYLTDEFK